MVRRRVLLSLSALACACVRAGGPAVEGAPPEARPAGVVPLAGLLDVACDGARCLALREGGRLEELPGGAAQSAPPLGSADTLRFGASGWEIEGPCGESRCAQALDLERGALGEARPGAPLPGLDAGTAPFEEALPAVAAGWNAARAAGWRVGFQRFALLGDGVALAYMPGSDAGTLARLGGAPRMVRVPVRSSDVRHPAWFATHPSGQEVYFVAWPSPKVTALDPRELTGRWWVLVEGAAQGLFLDPSGRWLVVGRGPGTSARLVDWELPVADASATQDPASDEVLRRVPRPPMDGVEVIDIGTRASVASLPGAWRRMVRAPGGGVLVATSGGYAFLGGG